MVNGALRYWYKGLKPETEVKSVLVPEGWVVTSDPYEVHSLEMLVNQHLLYLVQALEEVKIMNQIP